MKASKKLLGNCMGIPRVEHRRIIYLQITWWIYIHLKFKKGEDDFQFFNALSLLSFYFKGINKLIIMKNSLSVKENK